MPDKNETKGLILRDNVIEIAWNLVLARRLIACTSVRGNRK
jgi:hypothetical protein